MTAIGTILQPGQPIPDDVTGGTDREGDTWLLNAVGHWHTAHAADPETCGPPGCDSRNVLIDHYLPLTVTAVREQPAEPVEGFPGRTLRVQQREAYEQPDEPRHCGTENYVHGPHEWLSMAADGDKVVKWRCRGTGPAAEPEPQQADEPALLDLVRQYGEARADRMASVMDENEGYAEILQHKAAADSLFARIAALVPQQPVQATDCLGELFWQHDFCGEVYSDRGRHEQFCDPTGPWRPLLVGGDPAPKQPAQPDPMVLRLPDVSKDAESVVGVRSGRRYEPQGIPSYEEDPVWRRADDGALFAGIGGVLDAEAPHGVRVELAPPREPRTWPKLDEEYADLPSAVSVERHGTWRRLALPDDRLYQQADGGFGAIKVGLRLPLSGLRLLGEVTEVLDDEPGGAA